MKIGPDWDFAEAHGRANMVVDAARTTLDIMDKDSYCKCCHMPHPHESDFYKLCCSNMDLGPMGPGFPLYFEFRKYVTLLLFMLSVVFFIPAEFMIYESFIEYRNNLENDDSVISLWSFGAFVHHVGEYTGYKNLNTA
jgi:hypothetical protein